MHLVPDYDDVLKNIIMYQIFFLPDCRAPFQKDITRYNFMSGNTCEKNSFFIHILYHLKLLSL